MGENIKKPTAKYGLTEQQSINQSISETSLD